MALLADIAAQLPPRGTTARGDGTTTATAELATDLVRALQQASGEAGGLTEPVTVAAVAGQLADTVHVIAQVCGQLAGWLYREYGGTAIGLPTTVDAVVRDLHTAAWSAGRAGRTLAQVQAAAVAIPHPPGAFR